ncbi:MAG: NTP transferase domain-containing protein [Pirellulaceae bacterium]
MPRHFAIIPAAGKSTRMGAPKLLLPVDGVTMMEKTLAAWKRSRMYRIVVVVRPDDDELRHVCQASGIVDIVTPPQQPPQMKDSVQYALMHIRENYAPTPDDSWLMAPADMPCLSTQVINSLLWHDDPNRRSILVPTIGGRRGHPILFPWTLAAEVCQLSDREGLNVLTQRHPCREISCDEFEPTITAFEDVDTPEDLRKFMN